MMAQFDFICVINNSLIIFTLLGVCPTPAVVTIDSIRVRFDETIETFQFDSLVSVSRLLLITEDSFLIALSQPSAGA